MPCTDPQPNESPDADPDPVASADPGPAAFWPLPDLDLADLGGQLRAAMEGDAEGRDVLGEEALDAAMSDAGRVLDQQATAAMVVDGMRPGPALGYWIDQIQTAEVDAYGLPGAMAACQRLASWVQAKGLACAAQIAARAAASNQHIAVGPDGRPAQVPPEAAAEVALELKMSQFGAACWIDLAITLNWRLRGTAAALQDGVIDLTKARIMAEMTRRERPR
jgi:hypothetical protein